MKYNLGCGAHYEEGWVNVEHPDSKHKADIHSDLLSMHYDPCTNIKSHHVFEHFNYSQSLALIYKWTEALEQNGELEITIPDVETIASYLVSKNCRPEILIRYLYGSYEEPHWSSHKMMWTEDMFYDVFTFNGFRILNVSYSESTNIDLPNPSIIMRATKKHTPYEPTRMENYRIFLSRFCNGTTKFEDNLLRSWFHQFKHYIGQTDD